MKKTLIPIGILGAIACFALRKLQLAKSYDAAGLIPRGDKISLGLYLVCALVGALILILCLRERKGAHCEAKKSGLRGLLAIIAALALLGSYLPPSLEGGAKLIVPVLAFAAACAMAIEGVYHMNGVAGSLLGGCILPVYLAALLISDYRTWSYNPIVADFCFPLLFLVSAMLASYHLAAFRTGRGKRRTTAFLVGCALLFAGPVLVDAGWRTMVRTLAVCLYLIAELWPYLAKPIPIVEPAPEAEKKASDEVAEEIPVAAEEVSDEAVEELFDAAEEAFDEVVEEIPAAEAAEKAAVNEAGAAALPTMPEPDEE